LGLDHLDQGCRDQNLRSPMCAMVLLAYHSVITYYLGNGEGDVTYAEEILQPHLKAFPKGAIFLYYAGRIKQVQGKSDEATKGYNDSMTVQSEWKQFHHICYWELMWCYWKAVRHARMAHKATKWPIIKILTGPVMRPDRTKLVKYKLFCERILVCKSFTLVRHKQAKNYGAFARLITLASFLFPDPELGLCMQMRLLLGVPCTCAFVFEQSSSVFVALNVFASISLMPPKKILRLDSSRCLHFSTQRRTFSAQNLILTKLRNRLAPEISDKLPRIRIHGKGLKEHDFSKTLVIWHQQKKRFLKAGQKDYENHLLQSRLHFRIHSALQEIKHRRKQAKEAAKMEKKQSKRSKNGVTNNNSLIDESLSRQDSNSSFETAPEYSSEDERDLGEIERDSNPKGDVVLETTV
ncbi:unnamed protein product, partial [Pocillopora meandrina]